MDSTHKKISGHPLHRKTWRNLLLFFILAAIATAVQAADTDLDGIDDSIDNCPINNNPGQSDLDADGIGDVCDPSPHGDTGTFIYEDGNVVDNEWGNLRSPIPGTVVTDPGTVETDNGAIKFTLNGNGATYALYADNNQTEWNNNSAQTFTWKLKGSFSGGIHVTVETDSGKEVLITYTGIIPNSDPTVGTFYWDPSDGLFKNPDGSDKGWGFYSFINMDTQFYSAEWRPYTRNLNKDLQATTPFRNENVATVKFMDTWMEIGGPLFLDDIKLITTDFDSDGITDSSDNCPLVINPDQADSDNDRIGDACDSDSDPDGDGFTNSIDNCPATTNPGQEDADGDGIGDTCELTLDPDDDGISIEQDNCPLIANPDQQDIDSDSAGNACDDDDDNDLTPDNIDNCPLIGNENQFDADGDGEGNACDADDDDDGVSDSIDNCPVTANTTQTDSNNDAIGDACQGNSDLDGDGILNAPDNCPLVYNVDQLDSDADGLGVVCDNDNDNDGVENLTDNCPISDNPDQLDSNQDGIGDACSHVPDNDTDFILDEVDNCPTVPNRDQADSDNDGLGDACDDVNSLDSDGDGLLDTTECPDLEEPCPDSDQDGFPNFLDTDDDQDGILTSIEIGNTPNSPMDQDSDGVPNYLEPNFTDTDGDGLRNHLDENDDNDRVPTRDELGGGGALKPKDTDGDGTPDYLQAFFPESEVRTGISGSSVDWLLLIMLSSLALFRKRCSIR